MSRKRGSTSAVALGSDLVVVGGFDGSMFHDSVEVYDTRASQWRELASMAEPRAYASAANLDGRLYAIGGMLGSELGHNTTVESYDPHKDLWRLETFRTIGNTDADGVRLAFAAACVLDAVEG